jgi:hypothetical protein
MYAAREADGLVILDVLVSGTAQYATADEAVQWADGFGLEFPVMADTDGAVGAAWQALHPSHAVIDADGVITSRRTAGTVDSIAAEIDAVLYP